MKWLQRILKKAGYLSDSVDGDFGNNTEKALTSFQEDMGLLQRGKADGATLRALCSAAAHVNFIILPEPKKAVKEHKTGSTPYFK